MKFELWYLVMGALLVLIALVSSVVKRLPLTTTMLYLGVGVMLGPQAFKVALIDPLVQAAWLERLAELAVIVSLNKYGSLINSLYFFFENMAKEPFFL